MAADGIVDAARRRPRAPPRRGAARPRPAARSGPGARSAVVTTTSPARQSRPPITTLTPSVVECVTAMSSGAACTTPASALARAADELHPAREAAAADAPVARALVDVVHHRLPRRLRQRPEGPGVQVGRRDVPPGRSRGGARRRSRRGIVGQLAAASPRSPVGLEGVPAAALRRPHRAAARPLPARERRRAAPRRRHLAGASCGPTRRTPPRPSATTSTRSAGRPRSCARSGTPTPARSTPRRRRAYSRRLRQGRAAPLPRAATTPSAHDDDLAGERRGRRLDRALARSGRP